MKKIFLLVLVIASMIVSNAQIVGFTSLGQKVIFRRGAASELFSLPQDTFAIPSTLKSVRWVANKGDSIWVWSVNLQKWILGGGGGGGGGLSGTTDNLLKVTGANINANKTFGTLTYGATVTWNMNTGYNKTLTLTGDANLVFSNIQNGDQGTISVIQDGSGGHSLTVPDFVAVLNSSPGDTTVLGFLYDGGVFYWVTGSGAYTLAGADDVNIATPTNGQVLTYQTSDSKWHNVSIPSLGVGTYTDRLALSPINGTEFFQTNDGRNSPAGKYYYLNSVWNYVPMAQEDLWYYFNDFSATTATATLTPSVNTLNNEVGGTGATISFSSGNSMFYGLMSTGTTTTGFAKINTGQTATANTGFRASTMNMYYINTIQAVSQKSDLTNVFNIDAGFTNQGSANPPTSGYFFRYDSTSSANWMYRNGSGTLTATSVAFAANTPYTLEIFVRSDSVFYWINNTQVIAEATLQNTTFYEPYTRILKTAGATAVTMSIDYIRCWARLQTSRTNYGN